MISRKTVVTIIVTAAGVLLLVFVILSRLAGSYVEDLSSQRLNSALKELEKEQNRLGVRCVDGDKAILHYVDEVAPIAERLKNGKQLLVTSPILELGDRTSDVVNTCGLFKNMLAQENDHTLSNLVLGDEVVRQEFSIIRAAMTRTTASWCNAECILDAKKKIEESEQQLRQRLAPKVKQ